MTIFPLSLTLLLVIFLLDNARHSEGIINGQVADPRDYPYLVSLRNESGHYCGGALITRKHVLTAAHCLYIDLSTFWAESSEMYKAKDIKAVVDTTCEDLSPCTYQAAALTPHPLYNITNTEQVLNDIGIVTLEKTVVNENVHTIRIARYFPIDGYLATVAGWGTADRELIPFHYPSDTLHKLNVRVIISALCAGIFRDKGNNTWIVRDLAKKSAFCVFDRADTGTCTRDSGSPLVRDNKLLGLVIYGFPCALGLPDVYTSANTHIKWINNQVSRDSIDKFCDLSTNRPCRMKNKSNRPDSYFVLAFLIFTHAVMSIYSIFRGY